MRVAVFGTGGVGGYFGGRLAASGQNVTFIARGRHLEAIRRDGLQVSSINGDFVVRPTLATDDASAVGVVDMVLVCVKAWQVPEITDAIQPMLGAETVVVPLQNGVEAASQLGEALGQDHVVGGLCKIISAVVAPGRIQHSGIEPVVAIGEIDGSGSTRIERLGEVFRHAQITVELPLDIRVSIWEKFLLIAPWGGMGALTRVPVGILRAVPETRAMLERAMSEVASVASANGVDLSADVVSRTIAFIDGLPPNGTASMQRDVVAGLPSELDSQNGAVVRLGQRAGVDTPVNAFIYHSLRPLELTARSETV